MISRRITNSEKNNLEKYCKYFFMAAKIFEDESGTFISFSDYEDFSSALTADIINIGMDNQDVVNEVGRELYAIHDRIYYERSN